jgi:hypothetical protein
MKHSTMQLSPVSCYILQLIKHENACSLAQIAAVVTKLYMMSVCAHTSAGNVCSLHQEQDKSTHSFIQEWQFQ